jgi:hypothetical protein
VRHNNQGLIRFDHTATDGHTVHLRGVRTIELAP